MPASDTAPPTPPPAGLLTALGWTGVPLAAIALVIVLIAGLNPAGWLVGAGLFLINRMIDVGVGRLLGARQDVWAVGALGITMMMRAWICLGALLGVYFWLGREIALTATIIFVVLFTVDIAARLLVHAVQRPSSTGLSPGGTA